MKLARLGEFEKERAAVIVSDTEAVFVDDVVGDWNRTSLEAGAVAKVAAMDLSSRPRVAISDYRLGSPVAGMNPPAEPVIFMKAPDTVVGGFDDIIVPPGSEKTDYEVELCVVIGKNALYLKSPEDAKDHILGYTISQDVSERHWQIERSGQWVKGKSFPSFNPMGPWIVTADSLNPHDLRLWCTIDGQSRQDSRTSDLIFGIDHCIWYISQFMELKAGDIINTGTPQGVGMGFKPEKYIHGGEIVETGIEGIGTIRSAVRKA